MPQFRMARLASLRIAISATRSPDFNASERLWLRINGDYLSDYIAKTGFELEDYLCAFIDHPVKVASDPAFRK